MQIVHYFDYKSPYAYLAQADTLALARLPGVELLCLPYTLDIPSYLGRAEVLADGTVTVDERNAHQWRRVRYAYMDCRREANRRGLVIRGTRKIFDSSLAHMGYLYASQCGDATGYHSVVFKRFWSRDLDIEDISAIRAVLELCGIDSTGFEKFRLEEGLVLHDRIRSEAEAAGVFGVPSYLVDGELFWGNERLALVNERILQASAGIAGRPGSNS